MGNMTKSAHLNIRIEPDLKARLEDYPGPLAATVRVAVLEYLTKDRRRRQNRRLHVFLDDVRPHINTTTPRGAWMLEKANELMGELEGRG